MSPDVENTKLSKYIWQLGSKEQTVRVEKMRDSCEKVARSFELGGESSERKITNTEISTSKAGKHREVEKPLKAQQIPISQHKLMLGHKF